MARFFRFPSKSKGSVPGSLVFHGEPTQEKVLIRVMRYSSDDLEELECESIEEAMDYVIPDKLTWINIDGLHDLEIIKKIGDRFNIHSLLLEDMLNIDHRPKFHSEEDMFVVITKMLSYNRVLDQVDSMQLSLLARKNVVISFQEKIGVQFNPVRERIRNTPNRVRLINPDYLVYALMDCLVDNYLEIVGEIGKEIEEFDQEIINKPTRKTAEKIYKHRTEMNFLRNTVTPLREIILDFLKSESKIINIDITRDYIGDLNEHVLFLKESIDAYQMMVMDQMNMYNANISNKANEIMKTLTIFASFFIPLTFLAGIYGMNFDVIPELKWQWGYAFFWGMVLLLAGGLLLYFRRRKWF